MVGEPDSQNNPVIYLSDRDGGGVELLEAEPPADMYWWITGGRGAAHIHLCSL